MGADIHMYVEYRDKKQAKSWKKDNRNLGWYDFGDCINPGRNYTMFAVLAGVRGTYPDSFEPKGLLEPEELGWASRGDAYLHIIEKREGLYEAPEGCVFREDALKWQGWGRRIIDNKYIEHPDFHSYSYMNIKELKKAFKIYAKHASKDWGEEILDAPTEYKAILAAMEALEEGGANEVRVVFWFDN